MPRVVANQKEKFESDELFRKLSRECEVRYTGFRDRSLEERQVRFRSACREGHSEIAFTATGSNLHLQFATNAWSESKTDRVPTKEFVDFEKEAGKVHLRSQFIFNGVCVIFRAWMDIERLDGIGCLEYDAERAQIEDTIMKQTIEQTQRRLREFEERQRIHREELERRAEAEAEVSYTFLERKG
ncbi:core binding factor beta subunit [Saccoglossus kowalevskii]|uniref:Core binding factor beta subunit n=1 Tax=Saccoglossus kowalevskii TaxID=10224 RepID=D1LWY9_SACKO|nr:core binding factor beta subunit [Saccoglossus kowalevskii]ACY92495.1 core binding factor beta subunit [Saccoglossus kowalevskii]